MGLVIGKREYSYAITIFKWHGASGDRFECDRFECDRFECDRFECDRFECDRFECGGGKGRYGRQRR
jgi:hypothetical protein